MVYENYKPLTIQLGEKRQKFLFSRLTNQQGKVNIFQISEVAQWSNTLALGLQKLQSSFLGSRGPSGLIYLRPLGVKPQLTD